MFTGIIECSGEIVKRHTEGSNVQFDISSDISQALKVDQSVSHQGVCLTVTAVKDHVHTVVAVKETLQVSNLNLLKQGDLINLERSLKIGDRLDGHMVQGHVDATGICVGIKDEGGSWRFRFSFPGEFAPLIVDKGSICINGVSLTVIKPSLNEFEVTIIPYTYDHTQFRTMKKGDLVNLEFDILGKYLNRRLDLQNDSRTVRR
jgi:riboflavin synthase